MKKERVFNALAVMEAMLCPVLCLMYAFCGLAVWTQTAYFCPLLGVLMAALLFSSGNAPARCACLWCFSFWRWDLAGGEMYSLCSMRDTLLNMAE